MHKPALVRRPGAARARGEASRADAALRADAASRAGSAQPGGPQTPFQALWRAREYLRPYYARLALMVAAAVLAVTAEIMIPLLIQAAIDGPIAQHDRSLLLPIGLAAIAFALINSGLNLFRRWVQASAVTGMERTMRDDLYGHLQRLHPGFHDSWQSGQLLSRATTDLSAIRRFAGFGVVFFITNLVTFIIVVAVLIHLNWWLGLLTAGVFLPVTAICLRFEKRYRVLSRRAQDQQGDLATYVEEAAVGVRVLKALGRRGEAAARHLAQAQAVYQTQASKARLRGTFWAGLDLVPNAVIALVLLLGALCVASGALTLGGLVAFITLTLLLVWPIEAMGYILASGQEAATAAQRVYEILDARPAIMDREAPPGSPAPPGPPELSRPEPAATVTRRPRADGDAAPGATSDASLVFDHVQFCHPGAAEPLLKDVCLVLRPGETIALVGATGSGKTTLLQLVPRLADVTGGAILLGGTDVRDLPLCELRSRVACAFEDPTLFSASVSENVTLGAPGAPGPTVESALTAAQAGFVHDLPWGVDTRIGEQGMALSGGQRQRVALARAILTKPSVLVLDDPLSALDVHTEAKVTAALSQVLSSSTALVAAHRPSTVMLANRVALLADGVIAALGTHRELLATDERYRKLMGRGPDRPAVSDDGQPDLTSATGSRI
jgi:ATP-binding cassette, subfamily B, bacterial